MKNSVLVFVLLFSNIGLAESKMISLPLFEVEGAQAKQIFDLFAETGVGPGCGMGRCQTDVSKITCSWQYDGAGQLQTMCSFLDSGTGVERHLDGEVSFQMMAHMSLAGIKIHQDIPGWIYTSKFNVICDYRSERPEEGFPEYSKCIFAEVE